jgi:hypothetical protein
MTEGRRKAFWNRYSRSHELQGTDESQSLARLSILGVITTLNVLNNAVLKKLAYSDQQTGDYS